MSLKPAEVQETFWNLLFIGSWMILWRILFMIYEWNRKIWMYIKAFDMLFFGVLDIFCDTGQFFFDLICDFKEISFILNEMYGHFFRIYVWMLHWREWEHTLLLLKGFRLEACHWKRRTYNQWLSQCLLEFFLLCLVVVEEDHMSTVVIFHHKRNALDRVLIQKDRVKNCIDGDTQNLWLVLRHVL